MRKRKRCFRVDIRQNEAPAPGGFVRTVVARIGVMTVWWNAAAAAAGGGGNPGWLPPRSNGRDGTAGGRGRGQGSVVRGGGASRWTKPARVNAIGKNIATALSRNPGHVISFTSSLALGASTVYYDQHRRPSRPYNGTLTSGDPNRALTDALLWATAGGYVLQLLSGHAFTAVGAKVNAKIASGQVWRLLTPLLLHGSPLHLFVNCMSLNNLGPVVERQFGREQFMAVYLGAGLLGNFLSFKRCPNNAVGASSAIFGLVGALGIYLNRHRDLFGDYGDKVFQNLLGSVGLNAMFGMMSKRIDNWGHFGGFLGGVIVAWTVGPNLVVVGENERVDHRVEETRTVARRRVVNRPLLQTYTGEFMEEFRR